MIHVYFATWRQRPGVVKIGETDRPFHRRLRDAKTWLGEDARLHLFIPGRDRDWHERFSLKRADGEWFKLDDELAAFINDHPHRINEVKWRAIFRPSGRGGGSKPGKPNALWPIRTLVAADALWIREAGSIDAVINRGGSPLSPRALGEQMDVVVPGWRSNAPPAQTSLERRLDNRLYKMYYWGHSAGRDAPIRSVAPEHWRNRWEATPDLHEMHAEIVGMSTLRPASAVDGLFALAGS